MAVTEPHPARYRQTGRAAALFVEHHPLMNAPLNQLDWWRQPASVPEDPPLWRDPPRILFVVAGVLFIVGSLLPWIVGTGPAGQPVSFRATQGTGEGVMLIAGGLLLAFLARNRLLWETTSRSLQLLPLAVALISVPMWLGVEHFAAFEVDILLRAGGTAEYTTARYLVLAATALTVAGLLWLEWRRPADVRRRTRSLVVEWGLNRWSAAALAAAVLLGVLFAVLALIITTMFLGAESILIAVILAIFGLFVGIGLGLWLVERLAGLRTGGRE